MTKPLDLRRDIAEAKAAVKELENARRRAVKSLNDLLDVTVPNAGNIANQLLEGATLAWDPDPTDELFGGQWRPGYAVGELDYQELAGVLSPGPDARYDDLEITQDGGWYAVGISAGVALPTNTVGAELTINAGSVAQSIAAYGHKELGIRKPMWTGSDGTSGYYGWQLPGFYSGINTAATGVLMIVPVRADALTISGGCTAWVATDLGTGAGDLGSDAVTPTDVTDIPYSLSIVKLAHGDSIP